MIDHLISIVIDQGAVGLFVLLAVNCFGLPLPTGLVMLATGSLIDQGGMDFLPLLAGGIAGAVTGDIAGYALGRFGGGRIPAGSERHAWLSEALLQAEAFENRWGDLGIFLTRWLFTPLGPWVNLFAGLTRYPFIRFWVWDVLGESLWVVVYMGLGIAFSRSVQNLSELLGEFTWLLVFGAVAIYLGWLLLGQIRKPHNGSLSGVRR